MTDNRFDENARSYVEKIEGALAPFGQKHDFFVRGKADILIGAMSRFLDPQRALVLDVGCGIGLLHQYLKPKVRAILGVDVSRESVDIARQNDPSIDYRTYDGSHLPYDNGKFDCAYAICVMHHVPPAQWMEFLAEMARVVKPGGVVIIIEHNPFNPATRWVVRHCDLDEGAVLLWPRRLAALFREVGLCDVVQHYTLFTPFTAPIFRSLDQALRLLPMGAQYVSSGRMAAW
jgi:SAM-dependent methyltransferase